MFKKKILYIMTYVILSLPGDDAVHWTVLKYQISIRKLPWSNFLLWPSSSKKSSVCLSGVVWSGVRPSVRPSRPVPSRPVPSRPTYFTMFLLSYHHEFLGVITNNKSDVQAKGQRSKVKVTKVKTNFAPIWELPNHNSSLISQMATK